MIALVLLTALYGASGGYALPNPHVTPGKTVEITKQEVCDKKWGRDVRHVTPAMKSEVCLRYGVRACPGPHYEIDHLIPRELGGADDVENLWPQPLTEARLKDHLENFLHRAVCSGAIGLHDAQQQLRDDWPRAYERMRGRDTPRR